MREQMLQVTGWVGAVAAVFALLFLLYVLVTGRKQRTRFEYDRLLKLVGFAVLLFLGGASLALLGFTLNIR